MSLSIKVFALGMVAANCYIVKDSHSGEAFAVDPGAYNGRFEAMLEEMGIEKLKYILLTHGHFDHIMGVEKLKKNFGGEVVVHTLDAPCLKDADRSLANYFGFLSPPFQHDITVNEGDKLPFGDTEIEVIHTPGHTVGSVCYKIENHLFTGDTLFNMTCGRVDFPGGSMEQMLKSMKKLGDLEGDFNVYPGHEKTTTLDFERQNNPYMKGI